MNDEDKPNSESNKYASFAKSKNLFQTGLPFIQTLIFQISRQVYQTKNILKYEYNIRK